MTKHPTQKTSFSPKNSFFVNKEAMVAFENDEVWLFANHHWMRFQGRFARTIETAFQSGNLGKDLELLATTGLPGAQDLPGIIGAEGKKTLVSKLVVEKPSVLFVELTDRCCLLCSHCYANAGPSGNKFLDKETALSLMAQAGAMQYRRVQLTGGEPLLHPAFLDIVKAASKAKIKDVEIFTNGHLIDEQFLSKVPAETSFALSFYSHKLEVHDQITGVEGSGKGTLAAIDLLGKRGFAFRVATVLMEENADHWDETRDFLIDRGIPASQVAYGSVSKVGRGNFFPVKRKPTQERCSDDGEKEDLILWPGKACVSVDGNVSPCIFARWMKLGCIHERSLKDILQSPDGYDGQMLAVPDRWNYCTERLSCPDCRFLVFGLMGPRNG